MAVLLDLDECVLVLILLNLGVDDLLNLRKTCGAICAASRSKFLWLDVLRTSIADTGLVIPPSVQDFHLLSARQLEILVLMTRRNRQLWGRGAMQVQNVTRLDLPQMVDWLKIVHGRWLFVASSDNFVSKMSCWDMSLTSRGLLDPLAECYLPARVNSCIIDVENAGKVVLAVSLDSSSPASAVHMFGMHRQSNGALVFAELRCIPGLSYLHLLCNDYIVCGMRDGLSIPHLVNWKTSVEFALSPLPGTENSLISASLWGNYLIALSRKCVRVFTMPDKDQPPQLVQLLSYPDGHFVAEAASITKPSQRSLQRVDTSVEPATFMLLTYDQLLEITIDLQEQPSASQKNKISFSLSLKSSVESPARDLWCQLQTRTSGQGLMWLTETANNFYRDDSEPPRLQYSVSSPPTAGNALPKIGSQDSKIVWDSSLPVLWAYPQFDFDDSMGIVVVGNTFGELAIVDYLGGQNADIWSLSRDLVYSDSDVPCNEPAPQRPLPLNLPEWVPWDHRFRFDPLPPFKAAAVPWAAQPSIWDLDPTIPRRDDFCDDWPKWKDWYKWQGLPGDDAWFLERCYGIRGRPRPLAARKASGTVIFEAGGTYFIQYRGEGNEILSEYHADALLTDVFTTTSTLFSRAPPLLDVWAIPLRAYNRYERNLLRENKFEQRNRWVEQEERGGRPPITLLVMMTPPTPTDLSSDLLPTLDSSEAPKMHPGAELIVLLSR